MRIERSFVIDAPVKRVWAITAENFDEIGTWATVVPSSTSLQGEAVEGAPTAGRDCTVAVPGFSSLQETLTAFDPAARTFTYEIVSGLPGFVGATTNVWTLHEQGASQTRLEMEAVVETKGVLGALMGPMLKMNLNRTLGKVEKDLRHIAETGEPSPSKRRQLTKN